MLRIRIQNGERHRGMYPQHTGLNLYQKPTDWTRGGGGENGLSTFKTCTTWKVNLGSDSYGTVLYLGGSSLKEYILNELLHRKRGHMQKTQLRLVDNISNYV